MADLKDFQKMVLSLPRIEPQEGESLEYYHKGICVSKGVPEEVFLKLESFEVRTDDVFLVTYPKAGTTWMQQIISLLMEGLDAQLHKELHVFFRFPFLENTWISHHSQVGLIPPTYTLLERMSPASPRLIKTHLPPALLPRALRAPSRPKVVYVARNPRDVAVSYYHMHQFDTTLQTYPSWGSFLERFMRKDVCGGDWFEHNLFWWERRHDPNVLFVKYEDMQKDIRKVIVRTAEFLGRPPADEIVASIEERTRFRTMKRDPLVNPDMVLEFGSDDEVVNRPAPADTAESFMRKGQVGDWKNHFTVAQNERFTALYQKEMMNSDLTFDFEL